MTTGAPGSGDDALTRPMPISVPAPAPAPATATATATRTPYVHRFGSKPFYLVARLAAFAIDVLGVAFVLATFAFHGAGIGIGISLLGGHDANAFAFVAAVALGASLLLAFLFEAFIGTTPGKLIFALHVRRSGGGHPGIGRVFVRALLRPVDAILIGPLLALVTPKRQRLGDLLGGTVVSESPLRWFAPLVGLAIVAGIAYAQVAFGGGLDSAIGVAAETANDAPGIVSRAVGAIEPRAVVSQPSTGDPTPLASAAP